MHNTIEGWSPIFSREFLAQSLYKDVAPMRNAIIGSKSFCVLNASRDKIVADSMSDMHRILNHLR